MHMQFPIMRAGADSCTTPLPSKPAPGDRCVPYQVRLYLEVLVTSETDSPSRFTAGRIARSLAEARERFWAIGEEFHLIHGEVIAHRFGWAFVIPYGVKFNPHGEPVITGKESDKLPGYWERF